MAIKRARLTIRPQNNPSGMEEALDAALKKTGLTRADIDIDLSHLPEPRGDEWGLKTHFGNWVLTPVLDNEASRKLAAAMGTELDNFGEILMPEDLKNFKVGDKVAIDFMSDFGLPVKSEGKVTEVAETYITILRKGSRKKGWQPRIGDYTTLRKIEPIKARSLKEEGYQAFLDGKPCEAPTTREIDRAAWEQGWRSAQHDKAKRPMSSLVGNEK